MNLTIGLTLVADAILIATMVVFMFQARYMARSTRASVYQAIADQMMSIDRLFIDHPELRPYFYGKKAAPSRGLNHERVAAATELFVDFMDNVVVQTPHIPEYLSGTWTRYFRDVAASSPSIREFWRTKREWYGISLQRVLDPACLIEEHEVTQRTSPASQTLAEMPMLSPSAPQASAPQTAP
jgi:hypothetical protein